MSQLENRFKLSLYKVLEMSRPLNVCRFDKVTTGGTILNGSEIHSYCKTIPPASRV